MKHISSKDNPLYKELKQLATSSQARRKLGRTLLDGVHLCQVYLQQVGMPFLIVASESAVHDSEVAALIAECESQRAHGIVLPDAMYEQLSQVENGIGLLFVVDVPQHSSPLEITRTAVFLDNLQDPGNLGSILRSAAAAGITEIYCGKGTVFSWSPKVLRAGMGAHFLLNIVENAELATLLKNSKLPSLATSSHAAQRIYEMDLKRPVIWLFGHEGQGVSDELLPLATYRVAVPHLGKVESLNVAASAAVCLFEQVRQYSV